MRVAIVGSRNLTIEDLSLHLPENTTEIVSGGAKGIDTCAEIYSKEHGIPLTLFLPEYDKYGRSAPIIRNKKIVDYSDITIAFWDGKSRGTQFVIQECKRKNKPLKLIII